ncbi:helix-turn-helix domain-containing protein [Ktedonobacter racemifer]|uniref:DNA binding domain protein, excisionase family n=1 Tax=Ktedonobacter racemifer DSM 44963 TaxID=485913 RepID=D6THE6_KTERA|nr:helix-turn-helix domain-containing protein [Ktedonobacter racemifer]EFH88951.1 DNA binding domain protein, excisionase family [Ktedonobacter racemifer DSM 44963]
MASDNPQSEEMVSTTQAGKMLGVTSKTIIRMIESGQIPGYRVNFVWRLKRSDIEAYLEAHRYKPGTKEGN